MDDRAVIRLRYIGLLVLAMTAALLWLQWADERMKYTDAIASTLTIGVGLLLLAEIAPAVTSFKAGGVEVGLVNLSKEKFHELEARIGRLEEQALAPKQALQKLGEAPAKGRLDNIVNDDQWKGRFGGKAQSDGFRLSASFRNPSKGWVEIVLKVDAPTDVATGTLVEFYLHQTFVPDTMVALIDDQRSAEISVISYGGFTAGAWIPSKKVELELDLSQVRGAPRIVREN